MRTETQELFDCDVDQLYTAVGGKKGDRASLPKAAQKAYIVNETVSTHRIDNTEYNGTQDEINNSIVNDVADTARNIRKWFPW